MCWCRGRLPAFISLILAVIISQRSIEALAQKSSRIVTFSGLPVDNGSIAAVPTKKFIIKSDLKGSVKLVVNKWLDVNEIRIKVKLDGYTGTNLSAVHVNYTKVGKDKDGILLQVYEPLEFQSVVKLNKNSLTFIIATGSTCLGIILLSVLVGSGIYFYKKYKKKITTRRYYELCEEDSSCLYDSMEDVSESTVTVSSDCTSDCGSILNKECSSSKGDCSMTEYSEIVEEDDLGEEEHGDSKGDDDNANEKVDDYREGGAVTVEDGDRKEDEDLKEKDNNSKTEDIDSKLGDTDSRDSDDDMKEGNNDSKEDDDDPKEDEEGEDQVEAVTEDDDAEENSNILKEDDYPKKGDTDTKEEDMDSKEENNDPKEDNDSKEEDDDSKEEDNDSKEEDNDSKEEDNDSKEEDNDSKEEDNDSKEEDNDSKEEDNYSKEEDNDSKEEDNDTKEEDNDSKEEDNDSKEEDNDSKEEDNDSKDEDNYSQEEDVDSKEEANDSEKEDNDSKEDDNDSKEEDNDSKEDDDNDSKEEDNDSKEEVNDSKEEDNDSKEDEYFPNEDAYLKDKEDENNNSKRGNDTWSREADDSKVEHEDSKEKGEYSKEDDELTQGGDDFGEDYQTVEEEDDTNEAYDDSKKQHDYPKPKEAQNGFKGEDSKHRNPVVHLSLESLNHSRTRTFNGSNILVASEDVRSADIVTGDHSSCSLQRAISSEDKRPESENRCPVKTVVNESIQIQRSTVENNSDAASSTKSFRGNKSFIPTNKFLFIVCLLASFSVSNSSSPGVNSLQTATSDIIIEIPAYHLSDVHVFFNQLHSNPLLVTGDYHEFTIKVFDVESMATGNSDKCIGKGSSSCDTGTCDPVSGNCICARGQVYIEAFQKCMPDCTSECPPGFFMAKSCTESNPGTCKRCKPVCAAGKYESTPCGGAFDRECTDLSALPPVIIKDESNIISENRQKAKAFHRKISITDDIKYTPSVVVNRGTKLEIIIKTLSANFDVVVGEVDHKEFDVDPLSKGFCSRHIPDYYLARRSVADRMFYFRKEGEAQCQRNNPHLLKNAVHCLGPDHDLIRLFDSSKSHDASNLMFVEKAGTCANSLQKCLDCRKDCAVRVDKDKCWHNEEQCYSNCESKNCICQSKNCPCFVYETSNCYEKRTGCVGRKVNVVTLKPVFDKYYTYCHVKLLRLASYELRTDIYVKGKLVASKRHSAKSEEDDFGYLKVKAPDLNNIRNRKYLVLRRNARSNRIDVGYYKSDAKPMTGAKSDSMAFRPKAPFALNEVTWAKSKCNDIKTNSFDKFPLNMDAPLFFHKLGDLPVTKMAKGENGYSKGQAFLIQKSESRKYVEFHVLKNKSVLRHFFPKATILNDDSLECRLINKTSFYAIDVKGKLSSCPGFFSAKHFDQDHPQAVLHHYDFVVKRPLCSFHMQFNIPFKNDAHRVDKAFVVHLTSGEQTVKIVVVRDKKVTRILNTINLPKLEPSKLANILTPIATVAVGFIFLLIVLLMFGFFTRPKDDKNQGDRDNEFHFRHVFLVTWYVGARLSKSLLFTIVFLTYLFTVIHSNNYYTLKTFKSFQTREHAVFKGIYIDMEKHRVSEIHRQEKALTEEKNKCDMKIQQLDDYLEKHRQKTSLKQRIEIRAKSIKNNALLLVEKNLANAEAQYDMRRIDFNNKLNSRLQQIRDQVDAVEGKVIGNSFARSALSFFKIYRFFGGSKPFSRYIGLNVHFGGINYRHTIGSFKQGIVDLRMKVAELKSRKQDEKSYEEPEQKTKTKIYIRPTSIKKIRYPKPKIKMEFDNDQAKKVFALSWISKLVKDKILSAAAMAIMLAADVLFFIYRHTRTYAMAVMMIYGFKKYCDLDELETERLKREEQRQKLLDAQRELNEVSSSDTDVIFDRRQIAISDTSSSSVTKQDANSGLLSSDTQTETSGGDVEQNYPDESSSSDSRPSKTRSLNSRPSESRSRATVSSSRRSLDPSPSRSGASDSRSTKSRSSDSWSSGSSTLDHSIADVDSLSDGDVMNPGKPDDRIKTETGPSQLTICSKTPLCRHLKSEVTKKDDGYSNDNSRGISSPEESGDFDTACERAASESDRPRQDLCTEGSAMKTPRIRGFESMPNSHYIQTENKVSVDSSGSSSSENLTIEEFSSSMEELSDESGERKTTTYNGHLYEEIDQHGYLVPQQRKKSISLARETNNIAMTGVGALGSILLTFVKKMKKLNIINVILFNTHIIPMIILICFILVAVYFVIITAKFVLHTPILDEVGFFDLKISPVVAYRKAVNTRTSANAFMINHVHIPYYEARINARINMYKLKAKLYKKLQCVRTVLHNSEYCSWAPGHCEGIKTIDEGFYKNLTQFKCHMKPAIARRYSKFDKIQFKMEMMRSYDPYVQALRGIILDTFDVILAIIAIQILISVTSNTIFKMTLKFDLIRQIKVYKTKRPIEIWTEKEQS